jgi:hypothetical protein
LLNKIGINRKTQQTMKINHFDEAICLGLTSRPIKNKTMPIPQAISCLTTKVGATELTIKILMQKRKTRLIKTANQGFFDIKKF